MIKIEINAETGVEARSALLELLGLTSQSQLVIPAPIQNVGELAEQIADVHKVPMQIVGEAPKKRRTKAEIEAEAKAITPAAEETNNEPDTSQATSGTVEPETAAETTVTKEDLQKKAVELGRVGKKELCRAVLQKFGADSISTADKNPLKVELYAEVLAQFNEL